MLANKAFENIMHSFYAHCARNAWNP